jgi:pimeloyl-ACP methyl ester carboxylesterase
VSSQLDLDECLRGFEWQADHGVLNTGRYRLPYTAWGSGPPLIFVHGLGDCSFTFALPMSLLHGSFRCVAYDQPTGRGDGARIGKYRHEHLVEDLFALMDHLNLPTATVVGYSFGSTVALRAMAARPERIPRAVLICGFAHRPLVPSEWWLAWFGRYLVGNMADVPFRREVLHRFHCRAFMNRAPEVWRFFLEHTGKPPVRAVAHWALRLHETNVSGLLPAIRQPVLQVCGEEDTLVPYRFQEHLFRNLPNAVIFRIGNCGHFPTFTHPELMVEAMRRFLGPFSCPTHVNGNGHPAHAHACHPGEQPRAVNDSLPPW